MIKCNAQKTVINLCEKDYVPVFMYKHFFSFLQHWILIYLIETAKQYRKPAYRENSSTTGQCYLKAVLAEMH